MCLSSLIRSSTSASQSLFLKKGDWIVSYVVARNALNGEQFTLHDVQRLYRQTRGKNSRAPPPKELEARFKQETKAYRWFLKHAEAPSEADTNRQRIAKRRYKLLRDKSSVDATPQSVDMQELVAIHDMAVQDKGRELRLPLSRA